MKRITTENFTFLDFTEMDAEMSAKVLSCRNMPEVRKWMVNKDIIPEAGHKKFIESLKGKTDARYYCVIKGGEFAGVVNFHYSSPEEAERGIYLHPDFWKLGLSKEICREIQLYLRDNEGLKYICTKVFKGNESANALQQSLGAHKISEDEDFNYYRYDMNDLV